MQSFYHSDMESGMESEGRRITRLEERTKAALRRIDRLERLTDEMHAQNEHLARLTVLLETLTAKLEKQEKRLEDLEKIPEKRYTAIIGAVITSLVSALLGGALTVLF